MDDPLVPRTLLRLRRTDPAAARRAERALDELLGESGLADLTQHNLQTYLWYTLADAHEPQLTAAALQSFFELAELYRYAALAQSAQTKEILRAYEEQGPTAGARAAAKAMDASGLVPPDLPELEWGEIMGTAEMSAYDRIAATLELAQAAGELKPGGRGWRLTQQRLTRQQLTMPRLDGPPLLDRVRAERLDSWTDVGGHERRGWRRPYWPDLLTDPVPPRDVDRADGAGAVAAGAGRGPVRGCAGDSAHRHREPCPPSGAGGCRALRLVGTARPTAAVRVGHLAARRAAAGAAAGRRVTPLGRRLVLGTRGRALLGDAMAQWTVAMAAPDRRAEFDVAAQEAALMLLLQARGMVEVRDLVQEVAEVLGGSGWRDTGDGAPPDERDVSRAVWSLLRRCELWSMVDEGRGPGFTTRLRLSDPGIRGAHAALRMLALRPRMESD